MDSRQSLVRLQSAPPKWGSSSVVRAASVRSNSTASLARLQFHHGTTAMIQPQHSNQEAVWHTIRTHMKTLISKSPASVAKGSHPKRRRNAAYVSRMGIRNSANSWAGTIFARAALDAAFKKCCLHT